MVDHQADPDTGPSGPGIHRVLGWYGGLHIDLTVSTGTDPIDPQTLLSVIHFATEFSDA